MTSWHDSLYGSERFNKFLKDYGQCLSEFGSLYKYAHTRRQKCFRLVNLLPKAHGSFSKTARLYARVRH